MQVDHIEPINTEKKADEIFVPATPLWLTRPLALLILALLAASAPGQTAGAAEDRTRAVLEALPAYAAQAEEAIDAIRAALPAAKDAKVRTALLNAQLRAEVILSVGPIVKASPRSFSVTLDRLNEWRDAVAYFREAAAAGRDGFEGMTSGVRALRSPIDGQLLFYKFRLPADYAPEKKYPLVVDLHSGSGLVWRAPWVDGKPSAEPRKAHPEQAVWISPCGRGNNCYAGPGHVALVQEIEDAIASFAVDPDRVYCGGASMGGTGSFRLGALNPQLVAGIESLTGGAAYGYPAKSRFDSYQLVDNFANVAVLIFDAPGEGHFEANRRFVEEMQARAERHPGAYRVREVSDPQGRHGVIDRALQPAGRQWLREHSRNAWPKLVVYKTPNLRHNRAYWVRVEQFDDPSTPARIEARCDEQSVRVRTENLTRFALDLAPQLTGQATDVSVEIDGQPLARVPAGGPVAFVSHDGRWSPAARDAPADDGLVKRHGMSGPMLDVFMEHPVLFVHGDRMTPAEVDQAALNLFGPTDGGSMLHTLFDRKADAAVTDQDIASSNLVLLGSPATNALVRRIADKLPAKFAADGIRVGGRLFRGELFLCYPNPLNPQRYILIVPQQWSPPPTSIFGWGDWMVLDGGRVSAKGDFDARWQFRP